MNQYAVDVGTARYLVVAIMVNVSVIRFIYTNTNVSVMLVTCRDLYSVVNDAD